MRTILFLTVLFFTQIAFSQQTLPDSIGTVLVKKDPRLDILSAKQIEINRRAIMNSTRHINGYRVQVLNSQNRDEANSVKAEMLRRFPDQKSYLLYKSPNFRVRVGNFLSRKDAESLRSMIADLYPNRGIYVVSDVIEYRGADDDDYQDIE